MRTYFINLLIKKYLNKKLSKKGLALLDYYVVTKQKDSTSFKENDKDVKHRIWFEIDKRIHHHHHYIFKLNPKFITAAAVVMVLAAAIITFKLSHQSNLQETFIQISTKETEHKQVRLPDGSMVKLNAGSTISYSSNFNVKNRTIMLKGEAYFMVVHNANKPFIVNNTYITVKVLGTTFNLKAYDNEDVETSLVKGSIQVFLPHKKTASATLKPNEKFLLQTTKNQSATKETTLQKQNFKVIKPKFFNDSTEIRSDLEWVSNRISFDNEVLETILKRLERRYNVDFKVKNTKVLKYRFTGTFNDASLIAILNALKLSQDFDFRKEGNVIVIN